MKKILLPAVLVLCIAASFLLWRQFRPAQPITVGMVTWMASGAVVGSSEMHASDLFLEEKPQSRVRVLPVDDERKPERTRVVIQDAIRQGVRFFISAHPSNCAVASLHLLANSQALLINTASTSPALTGKDDFFLRLIPDAVQEQRALANYVHQMQGKRLLVLQDTGNPAYTDAAFATFSAQLSALGKWQIVHRPLLVAAFKPDELRSLMAEPFDALYILAGSFQGVIGNIAQLFHLFHPDAPIVLTPWAQAPALLETAGDAIDKIILPSLYSSRHQDPAIDGYFRRFSSRFGYQPHSMTIGVRQALELLDQAFAKGYNSPEQVKQYLLSIPTHTTSLGSVAFDRYGDVTGTYQFIQDIRRELR
jgi:branched-chain amino acid transport system substrate-binding protein